MSDVGRTPSPLHANNRLLGDPAGAGRTPSWPLRHEWPAETLALNVPPSEAWCDPPATFDCQGEGACRDCGNDLDTLCPLIALPGVLAVTAVTAPARGSS